MHDLLDTIGRYGYWLLFLNIFAEQGGLPLPAAPVLMAVGALVGFGKLSFWLSLATITGACLTADYIWFTMGKHRGNSILNLLCRISLEPDSCVSQTHERFRKWGQYTLLFSKFVPGLNAAAAPLAGLSGMSAGAFLLFDLCGTLLFALAYLSLGFLFRTQLERVADTLAQFGLGLGATLILTFLGFLAYKYWQRRKFIKELRVSRISPQELRGLIDEGSDVTLVDVRNRKEVAGLGLKLPNAIYVEPNAISSDPPFPLGREIVLYCSCPNEKTSALLAMQLLRVGALRVRPLEGGFEAWQELGYPLEEVSLVD